MLVVSWRELKLFNDQDENDVTFNSDYLWENFIIRLWLYRTTVNTLTKLDIVKVDATAVIDSFDNLFLNNGQNGLKALRNMIEHFDDYAAGKGRGPAKRDHDLDPWRELLKTAMNGKRFILNGIAHMMLQSK